MRLEEDAAHVQIRKDGKATSARIYVLGLGQSQQNGQRQHDKKVRCSHVGIKHKQIKLQEEQAGLRKGR